MRASVVIATYQEGDRLWKTVQSCVEASAALDYEIVVADDGSTDRSVEELLRRFPQVRVVCHDKRQGVAATKSLGARNARGDVLVFLDAHTKPEYGAVGRLVEDIEELEGEAIVTPRTAKLDTAKWHNDAAQVGHGWQIDLETFATDWLRLEAMRRVRHGQKQFYESPALVGCAFALSRRLYDQLWGFDPHMRFWGAEDIDLGLKCWFTGHSVLHDPESTIGHRFRDRFDNYDVPLEFLIVNQLRATYKNFAPGTWNYWVDQCRRRRPDHLPERPEGLWTHVWSMFESARASADQERSYLHARRVRDEFWLAEHFGLKWPVLLAQPRSAVVAAPAPAAEQPVAVAASEPVPAPRSSCSSSSSAAAVERAAEPLAAQAAPLPADQPPAPPQGSSGAPIPRKPAPGKRKECCECNKTFVVSGDKCPVKSENSAGPVRFFNGEIQIDADDLNAGGSGTAWGHTRKYSNQMQFDFDFGNGYNWLVREWP